MLMSKNKTTHWICIGVSFLYVPDLSRQMGSSYDEMCINQPGFCLSLTLSNVLSRSLQF